MNVDSKWLELGVTAGLLVMVVVYILTVHIPRLIRTFEEGLKNMALALKDVNTSNLQVCRTAEENRRAMMDRCDEHHTEYLRDRNDIAGKMVIVESRLCAIEKLIEKPDDAV